MASRHSLILLLLLFFIGCRPATPPPAAMTQPPGTPDPPNGSTASPATPTVVPDEVEEIRNAQYQLGASDTLEIVQLTDGSFEQGTPGSEDFISVSVTDFVALGDLNADGTEEAAALISENYGGTGVFVPKSAVYNDQATQSYRAFVIVDGVAKLRVLQLGGEEGDSIQILDGLAADETVATSNLAELYEGAKVVSGS